MKRRLAVSLLLFVFVAAGTAWWFLRPTPITFLTDADTIREAATQASLREVLWQRPTPLLDLINDQADEFEPRVSRDGGTLFFVRGKPGHNADIFVSTRERSGWSRPAALAEINTPHDELGPEPSADGQSLYFYSDRPGGMGGYDLWVAHKSTTGWRPPTNLGNAVNTAYNEYGPALSPDGRTLCFSTNRPKPSESSPSVDAWRATVREDLYRHDYDLYAAKIPDAGLQSAIPLDTLNSTRNDGAPAYSPIGDFLYFSSDRPGGQGGFDLYRSRIAREHLQPPANLGIAINTAANELDPALDVGGYALHFSSDRPTLHSTMPPDIANGPASPARYHLYRSFSREVFHDIELRQPVIDWAGLWKQVGPNVMWALLALVVFILLWRSCAIWPPPLELAGAVPDRVADDPHAVDALVQCRESDGVHRHGHSEIGPDSSGPVGGGARRRSIRSDTWWADASRGSARCGSQARSCCASDRGESIGRAGRNAGRDECRCAARVFSCARPRGRCVDESAFRFTEVHRNRSDG